MEWKRIKNNNKSVMTSKALGNRTISGEKRGVEVRQCQCGTVECQRVSAAFSGSDLEMYCTTVHKGSSSTSTDVWQVVVEEYGRPGVVKGRRVDNMLAELSKIPSS